VNYYNHERYHESLDNLTPADALRKAGWTINPDELMCLLDLSKLCPKESDDVHPIMPKTP